MFDAIRMTRTDDTMDDEEMPATTTVGFEPWWCVCSWLLIVEDVNLDCLTWSSLTKWCSFFFTDTFQPTPPTFQSQDHQSKAIHIRHIYDAKWYWVEAAIARREDACLESRYMIWFWKRKPNIHFRRQQNLKKKECIEKTDNEPQQIDVLLYNTSIYWPSMSTSL